MSRRPFDPGELDRLAPDDHAVSELERYVALTATGAPRSLEQRVMAAVDAEPLPRRGLLARFAAPRSRGGFGQLVRAGALAGTLVLAVAGALFAGQLASLVRNQGAGSPTPTVSVSQTPSPSPSPLPSVAPTMTTSPELTSSMSPSPPASPQATPKQSIKPGESEGEGSSGSPGASRTPRPSPSPSP